jgi:hypothetical protein
VCWWICGTGPRSGLASELAEGETSSRLVSPYQNSERHGTEVERVASGALLEMHVCHLVLHTAGMRTYGHVLPGGTHVGAHRDAMGSWERDGSSSKASSEGHLRAVGYLQTRRR